MSDDARNPWWLLVPALVGAAVFLLDQVTKIVVIDALGPTSSDHRRELLGAVLAFEYVENQGAAFGLLQGRGTLLILIAGVLIATLVLYYRQAGRSSLLVAISLGCLIGGAVGNVVDRIRLGHVVDFIAVGVWPKFNVADSAISIGVLLLGWYLYRGQHVTESSREREESVPPGRRLNEAAGRDA